MKRIILLLAACFVCVPVLSVAADDAAENAPTLESFAQKLSYTLGMDVGSYFKSLGNDIDLDLLVRGIQDSFNSQEPALSSEEMVAVQKEFAQKMQAEKMAKMAELQQKNLTTGNTYLEENKKKEGVMVTASGLQYEVLKQGDGPKPEANDTVKVDYVGSLIDGTEFDSSIKRGQPVSFNVSQVIPGWTEALQLMATGSKYRLVIPSDLAYGAQGRPPVIEPNSVLVFEVDLHAIE